jgi:CRP/FNR family transcriptional regulator, dissimilatory nitrate respiration regulator
MQVPKPLPPSADTAGGGGADDRWPRLAHVSPSLRQVAAHALLFRQGDPTFGVFRLASGRIRLVRVTPDGEQVPMHTVRPGELFAEASLFSAHYHCDAVATQASEVLVYPKADLARRLKVEPDEEESGALWAFAAEMAHRIHELRMRLEMRQIRSATERVLQSLRLRCAAVGTWTIDGTLKQFAEDIGLSHEALYRALAVLERAGKISRHDGQIKLLTPPRNG